MLGPVEVDFLRPTMQRALAEQLDGFTVDFEHTVLAWGGWRRAVDLRVTKVKLKDRHGLPVDRVAAIGGRFQRRRTLLRGNYTPRRIEFFSPVIMLSRKADGSFILRRDDRAQDRARKVIEQLLKSMLEPPSDSNDLRQLSITDAVLDIDDLAGVRKTGASAARPSMCGGRTRGWPRPWWARLNGNQPADRHSSSAVTSFGARSQAALSLDCDQRRAVDVRAGRKAR